MKIPMLDNELLNYSYVLEEIRAALRGADVEEVKENVNRLRRRVQGIYFQNVAREEILAVLKSERFKTFPALRDLFYQIFSDSLLDPAALAVPTERPERTVITTQFHRFNTEFRCFSEVEVNESTLNLFETVYAACHVITTLIEETSNEDEAYQYAYKLMALFADEPMTSESEDVLFANISKSLAKLLKSGDSKTLHDLLLVRLNLPNYHLLNDKSGWVALIKKEGQSVLSHFTDAHRLEEIIVKKMGGKGRAPKDLREANSVIASLTYPDRGNPGFEKLCNQYKVSEERYTRVMNYMSDGWPKKTRDLLPDVRIVDNQGSSVFCWVKLPVDDPRALILGDITDCCQSIAGDSSVCVMDGASRAHNGFYVLLKKIKKGDPVDAYGQINYKSYEIIGQSYGWLTTTGHLCLDSIETLKGRISFERLKKIVTSFAIQVLDNNLGIHRVTLGMGGRTPKEMFQETLLPERMQEGKLYGDARRQYVIAERPKHAYSAEQEKKLASTLAEIVSTRIVAQIRYLQLYLPPDELDKVIPYVKNEQHDLLLLITLCPEISTADELIKFYQSEQIEQSKSSYFDIVCKICTRQDEADFKLALEVMGPAKYQAMIEKIYAHHPEKVQVFLQHSNFFCRAFTPHITEMVGFESILILIASANKEVDALLCHDAILYYCSHPTIFSQKNLFTLFIYACGSNDLEGLNQLLSFIPENKSPEMVALYHQAFQRAVRNGHIDIVNRLLEAVSETSWQVMIAVADGFDKTPYAAFHNAALSGHLAVINRLLEVIAPDKQKEMISSNEFAALRYSVEEPFYGPEKEKRRLEIVYRLLAFQDCFVYAVRHYKKSLHEGYVPSFVQVHLEALKANKEAWETDHPGNVFDVSEQEVNLLFDIMSYMITQNEPGLEQNLSFLLDLRQVKDRFETDYKKLCLDDLESESQLSQGLGFFQQSSSKRDMPSRDWSLLELIDYAKKSREHYIRSALRGIQWMNADGTLTPLGSLIYNALSSAPQKTPGVASASDIKRGCSSR